MYVVTCQYLLNNGVFRYRVRSKNIIGTNKPEMWRERMIQKN